MGIIIVGVLLCLVGVGMLIYMIMDFGDNHGIGIAGGIICLLGLIMFACGIYNTESVQRELKTLSSDLNGGLNRTLTVYDYTGNEIKTYTGKFDISNNDQGVIRFDINGKRHLVYNAIVIVDEN